MSGNTRCLADSTTGVHLSSDQQTLFLAVLQRATGDKPPLTSREECQLRRTLQQELETADIGDAEDIADTLVEMGVLTDIAAFLPLLRQRSAEFDPFFEPFFTTKPPGEGSGLGLDIVRKIIEKHQGTIMFVSQPGRTTFTVALPLLSVAGRG